MAKNPEVASASERPWVEPLTTIERLLKDYGYLEEASWAREALDQPDEAGVIEKSATMRFWGGMGSLIDPALSSNAGNRTHLQVCNDEIELNLAFKALAQWLTQVVGAKIWTVRIEIFDFSIRFWKNQQLEGGH